MKINAALFFIISLLCGQIAAGQKKMAAAIDSLFSSLAQKQFFNGAVVTGQNGKILFSKGYGYADFSTSVPFTSRTVCDGGSNAKTFTAAGLLLLESKSRIELHAPVQDYISSYPYQNTSTWNLFTHSTGGLPDYSFYFDKIPDTAVLTTPKIIDILNQHKPPLVYDPGSNFFYDNPAFDVAATIIEKVSGLSYQQFLSEHFFAPLQMNTAFVRPAKISEWKGERVKGYRYQGDSLKLFDIADREGFYGGSNIWVSAGDLYKWGTSFYHKPVLTKAIIKQVMAPVKIGGKLSAITLGAWYPGKNEHAFYYWGNLEGFYSWVYWDRKRKFTIAFVSNTNTPQWLRPRLTHALISIMEGNKAPEINQPDAEVIKKDQWEKITGHYKVPTYGRVEIGISENNLLLKLPSGMEYRMYQVEDKTFYVPGLEPWLSFGQMENGKCQKLYWSATVLEMQGKRI